MPPFKRCFHFCTSLATDLMFGVAAIVRNAHSAASSASGVGSADSALLTATVAILPSSSGLNGVDADYVSSTSLGSWIEQRRRPRHGSIFRCSCGSFWMEHKPYAGGKALATRFAIVSRCSGSSGPAAWSFSPSALAHPTQTPPTSNGPAKKDHSAATKHSAA